MGVKRHLARTAIVIGAGVIGIGTAYALARRGWQVEVVDREARPAMGTSRANGAQLSYCYTDALGSPATFAALPQLLGGKGGVSFGLKLSPQYIAWLADFARNCTAARFRSNTLAVLQLAMESSSAMDRLCEQYAVDFAHRVAGKIHLLYTAQDIERAKAVRQIKQSGGVEQFIVPREEFGQLDPALRTLDPAAIAAISTPSEVVGDPFQFCTAMRSILEREFGVRFHFGAEVSDLAHTKTEAKVTLGDGQALRGDMAVVATGVWSNPLLGKIDVKLPIQPMKGYSFEMPLTHASPRISVTDGKRRLVFTHLGDRLRVAGIAELGNATRSIDPDRIAWMIDAARDCLPDGGDYTATSQHWTGLRPVTPNSQPIIKRIAPSLAINTGHGALGWTLAMGSGERLADLIGD